MSVAQLELTAFASGALLPIDAVPDPVFAGRMMGDGVAIDPATGALYAPCDGRIAQLHASHHACVVEAPNGARLLLHIGIDTVLLKGEGFVARVAQGDTVRAGQLLIEFDMAVLRHHGKPVVTILAVENGDAHTIVWVSSQPTVGRGDPLLVLGAPEDEAVAAPETAAPGGSATPSANGWAVVRHAAGLHARPCALLAHALKPFAALVEIGAHGRRVNARSATAVMGLNVGEGDEVELFAVGSDAGDALEAAVVALETASAAEHDAGAPTPTAASAGLQGELRTGQLAGVVASPGLVVGRAVRFEHTPGNVVEAGEGVVLERRALADALQAVVADIERAVLDAGRRGLADQADIFAAHRVLAEDPDLSAHADALIDAGKSAAYAWRAATEAQCETLAATGNRLLAGRAADLRDVERQVLRKLLGDVARLPELPADAVILADDLLPSDFAQLARARIAAIVTAQGGPTSHIAILARAQGIPALVALGPQIDTIADGTALIVDAETGVLDIDPPGERQTAARSAVAQRGAQRAALLSHAHEAAVTTDGVRVEVAANVANADDARQAVMLGAEAVGLLRTELLFIERAAAPSVAEQTVAYQAVVDALEGRCAIIRTLDVGADKSLPYIVMPDEENPALGQRGIRLSLAREELLVEQLRAILAVRPLSAVRIMLPMVTDVAEIVSTRALLDRLAHEMQIDERIERVELGVMIETPAAAVLADQLAQHADFFSVGTNDLTQYALCMDRVNPALASRVDGLHPAVLRLLAQAAQGAQSLGKWFGVCGALASDPLAVPLLIGLGVGELSVSAAVIPEIKAVVRRLDHGECRRAVQHVLHLASPQAVRAFVRETWPWLDHPLGAA
jgi:phosphocarrier protein FPr/phosphocarrier protein